MVGFFPALRRLEVPDAYDAYNAYDAYDAVAREAPKRRSALLERTLKNNSDWVGSKTEKLKGSFGIF